jgi:hypothetical protein
MNIILDVIRKETRWSVDLDIVVGGIVAIAVLIFLYYTFKMICESEIKLLKK